MTANDNQLFESDWRNKLHEIIFEADTPAGKLFDILLLLAILLSVVAVMLETVEAIGVDYGPQLRTLEWIFTILFTIEYVVRIICVKRPWKYVTSFYGIIDLLAVIPTYLSLVVAGTHSLIVIRAVRLLRVFRILKLARYLGEAAVLMRALRASKPKIIVFLGGVFTLVIIIGTVMYLVEGSDSGFTSIPKSTYWAIVTLTTVGYGDITPQTPLGQFLSAFVMVMGYGIIAVPTGIVSVELSKVQRESIDTHACTECGRIGHDADARFCKFCGGAL